MPYGLVHPVVDLSVRRLCTKPYQNHPRGCPNCGHKKGCPPACRTINQLIDVNEPVYAVWNEFDFAGHCLRMRAAHPEWSIRQIECCLYWQGTARKQLREEINIFAFSVSQYIIRILGTPEAAGVNVTATMKSIGINLEWPPKKVAYQIVIAGHSKPI